MTKWCFPHVPTGVVCGTRQLSLAHPKGTTWEAKVFLHLGGDAVYRTCECGVAAGLEGMEGPQM